MNCHKHLISRIVLVTLLVCLGMADVVLAAQNRGHSAPANDLPRELKGVSVKDYFLPGKGKDVGIIQTVMNCVVVSHGDFRQSYFAANGDKLYEGDVIFTLKDSRCRIKLIGEDVVIMGETTRMGIKTFQENRQKSAKASVFTMAKGKAMFYALRLFKYRSNAMVVETPTAVCGVRGTKWGVEVVELTGSKETASLPVLVADTSDQGFRILAQANPPSPPQFQTTILCFSGTVFTGSTAPPPPGAPPPPIVTLSQGQMTTVGSGAPPAPPSITPPSLANSFTADTFAPSPGDSGAPPPPPPPGALPPTGSTPTTQTTVFTAFTPPDTSNVTKHQAQQEQQEQITPPVPTRPTTHDGFFVGLATNTSMPQYQETYISDGQYMSFDIKAARAQSGLDYATAGMSSLEYLSTGGEGQYVMSGLPVSIQRTELGYNAYMEWGYWTQPNTMTDGTMAYLAFDNKGYYVWGDKTASLPSSFSGTFSGPARGTIYATGGGQDLTGNFSMNVTWNGSTGSISNFSALVGTAGANLTGISGASGTFNSTGVYTLTNGTWWVNNQSGTSATAVGSFYGPDAKLTGGVWKVEKAGTAHANGLFVGSRP